MINVNRLSTKYVNRMKFSSPHAREVIKQLPVQLVTKISSKWHFRFSFYLSISSAISQHWLVQVMVWCRQATNPIKRRWDPNGFWWEIGYHQTSNISRTLVDNEIVDHSDVVGASPVGAAPTTSSFSTSHLASMAWTKTTARRDEKHLGVGIWCVLCQRFDGIWIVNCS